MTRNIIFDLGGVLFNLDYNRTILAFENAGIRKFDLHFSQLEQNTLFDLFETGKLSSAEFRASFQHTYQTRLTDNEIDTAWNAMLIGFPDTILVFLSEMKKKYRLFLMSNANEIHIREVNRLFIQQFPENTLADYFEKMYFSFLAGLRKPDEAFFNKIISENNLLVNETAFFDDSPQHLETAKKLGINAFLVPKNTIISDFVNELIIRNAL